jgi:hypothetical protein
MVSRHIYRLALILTLLGGGPSALSGQTSPQVTRNAALRELPKLTDVRLGDELGTRY